MTAVAYQRNSKNITKKYAEYFLPTILTVMASNIAVIVDSVIVGNMIGSDALAAINVLSPIVQLYASLAVLVGLGLSTTVSMAKGKNDTDEANRLYTVGIFVLVFFSIVLMAVQIPFMNKISFLLSGNEKLAADVKAYYLPFVLSTPLTLFLDAFIHILRIDNRPKFATSLIVVSNIINLLMDIVYIKIFNWGIAGSSIATVTGQIVAFVILLSHFAAKNNTLHFSKEIFKNAKLFFGCIKNLVPTGFSAALGMLLLVIKLQFIMTLVQRLSGTAGLVAFSVYKNALILVSLFIAGGAQTMIPIVGMCMGEKDYDGVRFAFGRALRILLLSSVVIAAVLMVVPNYVSTLFGIKDSAVMAVCSNALRITAVSFIGVSVNFLCLYYFMAVKQESISTTISAMNTVGFVILSAIVCSALFGINGLWASFIVSEVLTLLMIFAMLSIKAKKSGCENFYLLPENAETLSLSFDASEKNSSGVSQYVCAFLNDKIEKNLVNKTAIAVEDITAEISKNFSDKKIPIDVRIVVESEEILISIRYGGKLCNPLEVIRGQGTGFRGQDAVVISTSNERSEVSSGEVEESFSAINVIKSISKSVEYSSVLGFNRVIIKI